MLLGAATLLRVILILGFLIVLIYYHYTFCVSFSGFFMPPVPALSLRAANVTLDFGVLLVVSGTDSPRLAKLLQAADINHIELTIYD